jgi:glycosyltransferase involved in cell wall biosynthesis
MSRYRVVYLDHVARLSGAEIALARLLDASRDVVEAHVILGEDGPLIPRLREAGATVEVLPMAEDVRDARKGDMTASRLPWRSTVQLARYVWALRRRLRELQPDLVHTNSLKAAVYGGLSGRLAGVPVVWHIRDRIAADYLPRAAVSAIHALSRVLPARVVTNSVTTLATLPLSPRTSVLYNALAPAPRAVLDPIPTRDPDSPFTVGMMGRIAPWKGQDVLLRAFASAFAGGPERLHLIGSVLFGEQHYEAELRALAATQGIMDQVVWRGFRGDTQSELALLDVLVHCSTTAEPFGQVVVEGMMAGLPVIAAADGGPVEIIDHGRDGVLVPPGDTHALASALRRLADDEPGRRRIGLAASASVERFAPHAAASRLDAVYRGLGDRRRR